MTNKLIIIFLAISLHKCVSAQSLESDKTLSFQNVSSIEFRPLEIDEVSFGYITRPNTLYRKKLIQGDTSSIADSNSYSQAMFNIGSIATQNIGFRLFRPINESGDLMLNICRESNPGWVARSFVRYTDIHLKYFQKVGKRIETHINTGVSVLDREQNGGVLDSIYYDLSSNGTNELNLIGNTFLPDAYNRHFDTYLKGGVNYSFAETNKTTFKLGIVGGMQYHKFRYQDGDLDTSYYDYFTEINQATINDSFRLNEFWIKPNVQINYLDSLRGVTGFVNLEIKQSWYGLLNNGRSANPMNQMVQSNFYYSTRRFMIKNTSKLFLQGYNKGDLSVQSKGSINIAGVDSLSDKILRISSELLLQQGRPSLLYERYESSITIINSDQRKVSMQAYSVGMDGGFGPIWMMVQAGYRKIGDFIFLNQNAEIFQKRNSIEIYSVKASIAVKGKWYELNSEGCYQWNDRSKYYSVPEWINTNQGFLKWNMFSKKLRMRGGVQTEFYSSYYSRGYLPFYDAFYVQSFHRFEDFFQLNAMLTTRIKTVTVGVSAYNILYGVFDVNPIIAPNMAAVPRYFSLQFAWDFKN